MDLNLVFKLVTAAVGFFSILFSVFNFKLNNKKKLIEEFTVAKSFLEEIENIKNPFVIDKGYYAIAGTKEIPKEVIKYLLLFNDSVFALDYYKSAMHFFVKPDIGNNHFKLSLKPCYKFKWCRIIFKIIYLVGYIISFLFSTISYWVAFVFVNIYKAILAHISFETFILCALLSFSIGAFCVYLSLKNLVNLKKAERLMILQDEKFAGLN
ncbi:hypothetical protein [Photobacterium leiognathi]|uniref:hypothetical protein n=1 Tax=Photobacterium leiognathi TaxID=553611 RepID=UPI0002088E61|nr:hypothetical protein [Photobacterium leiognathi]PSW47854.1 hypothetical protein CTM83_20660 [Photobacterium leiognathi subsp. mandapamensis]GAA06989.1 hypothetical protein PMSV_4192 [Photobacterium leiognathi subsp. mandapamensis svers.1.1.]